VGGSISKFDDQRITIRWNPVKVLGRSMFEPVKQWDQGILIDFLWFCWWTKNYGSNCNGWFHFNMIYVGFHPLNSPSCECRDLRPDLPFGWRIEIVWMEYPEVSSSFNIKIVWVVIWSTVFHSGWWFGTCFICPETVGNFHPSQLTFTPSFGVGWTTDQLPFYLWTTVLVM